MEEKEEKNRKLGLIVSFGVHALLLLSFLFIIAWREPDPPLPEYGIELNFGLDNAGSGDVQPETPVNESESQEEAQPENVPEQTTEDVVEPTPEPQEVTTEPVSEAVSTQESPDVVPKEEPKKEIKEKVEEQKKPEQKKVEQQPEQPETGAQGDAGQSEVTPEANQGDRTNQTGDQGDPEGTLDSRALYGNPGGGGGSSLEMTGWTWDFEPKPNDKSDETGIIKFRIEINDRGEILRVNPLTRGVSPAVLKIYQDEVQKLTFSRTTQSGITPPRSTGTITFRLKAK